MTYEHKEYLAHHGIKGQKWGVRRYQNEDGSLTEEGKKQYQQLEEKTSKSFDEYADADDEYYERHRNDTAQQRKPFKKRLEKAMHKYENDKHEFDSFVGNLDLDKYVKSKYSAIKVESLAKSIEKSRTKIDKFIDRYVSSDYSAKRAIGYRKISKQQAKLSDKYKKLNKDDDGLTYIWYENNRYNRMRPRKT